MDTMELLELLGRVDQCTRSRFLGVFPSDRIPVPRKDLEQQYLIINLDPASRPGSHWVAVHLKGKRGLYFDSYGKAPFIYKIRKYLDDHCDDWTFNKIQRQSYTSTVCGQFCVVFCALRCRGLSMNRINEYLAEIGEDELNDCIINLYKQ